MLTIRTVSQEMSEIFMPCRKIAPTIPRLFQKCKGFPDERLGSAPMATY
jgi:hypothetical protein